MRFKNQLKIGGFYEENREQKIKFKLGKSEISFFGKLLCQSRCSIKNAEKIGKK